MVYTAAKPETPANLPTSNEPRHPVTPEMTKLTASLTAKRIPTIASKSTEGKTIVFAPESGPRPQFVYFVLDGCPCSYDAEPLFKKLGLKFKGKVDFVTVTNAGEANARAWSVAQAPPYPVVSDPEQKIIKAFGATNSVFSALLDGSGRVIKMWPGYSHDLLIEMNAFLSKAAGVPETKFDPEYAPLAKTSGCDFSEVDPAKKK